MPFIYHRTIRFQDTDAAGIVYFANVLAMCHEAYEASLATAGIDLRSFFSGDWVAMPIVHADVDFFQPMFCGEEYAIHVQPRLLSESKFEIAYMILRQRTLTSESVKPRLFTFALMPRPERDRSYQRISNTG